MQRFLFIIITLLATNILRGYSQEAYTGSEAKIFQKNALHSVQEFYNYITLAANAGPSMDVVLGNIQDDCLTVNAVLSPDFRPYENEAKVFSIEQYVFQFKETYHRYLSLLDAEPDALTFSISKPEYITLRHPQGNRYGLEVVLNYRLQILSMDKVLYDGISQAVVEYENQMHITQARIRQVNAVSCQLYSVSSLPADLLFSKLGIVLRPLTVQEQTDFHTPTGLYIEDETDGLFRRSDIYSHTVVTHVNGRPVKDVNEFVEAVNQGYDSPLKGMVVKSRGTKYDYIHFVGLEDLYRSQLSSYEHNHFEKAKKHSNMLPLFKEVSVPGDSMEWLENYDSCLEAANQGHGTAQLMLAFSYYYRYYSLSPSARRDMFKWFKKAVDNGNGWAMYFLGDCYSKHLSTNDGKPLEGWEYDERLGKTLKDKACKKKVSIALMDKGMDLLDEEEKVKEAIRYLELAIAGPHKDGRAANELYVLYSDNEYVKQDLKKAVHYLDQGKLSWNWGPRNMDMLCQIYLMGSEEGGIPADRSKYLAYLQEGANAGYGQCLFDWGMTLYEGRHQVRQDQQLGLQYIRQAAEANHLNAMIFYAGMLKEGIVVGQDYREALRLFCLSYRPSGNNDNQIKAISSILNLLFPSEE